MATQILSNAFFKFGSNDLSAYIESIEFNENVEVQDDTRMGMTTRKNMAGLKTWSFRISFHQDWADSLLDDILSAALGTEATIEFRKDTAVVGSSNPKWTGNGLLSEYNPVSGGAVGGIARCNMVILSAGALTR